MAKGKNKGKKKAPRKVKAKSQKQLEKMSKEELYKFIGRLQARLNYVEVENREMREELEAKIDEYIRQYEINKLKRSKEFGSPSEKIEVVVNEVEKTLEEVEVDVKSKEETPKVKKRRGPYKSRLENVLKDLKNVVQEKKVIDYDFEGNHVDRSSVKSFGSDITTKIEVEPVIKVVTIERLKYKDKDNIYEALSEDIFPHTPLTPSLAANIAVYRYLLQVPLYRYSNFLKSKNIPIDQATLCCYIKKTAEVLMPLYIRLKEEIKESRVVHIDETTIEVLDVKHKKDCYVFVYSSSLWDEQQIRLYEFNIDRKTSKVKELLKGYDGYVLCDGYAGYDSLVQKVQRCFTHIRRYFVDCLKVLPKEEVKNSEAYTVVELINRMYKLEAEYKEQGYTAEEIKERRNSEEYVNILKELDTKIESLDGTKNALLQKAVMYYKNIKSKKELYTFQESGYLEIDNNRAERTVRPFAVGRKNFLFCKTENGADITAQMYSIVETAKENCLDPEQYIKYVLENITKKDIEELLPWNAEIRERFCFIR